MNNLVQDIRYACRKLARSPGFALGAIATLALGLGANTAIFSFVNAVLLKPAPYPHPERIVTLRGVPPGGGQYFISTPDYLDWQKQNNVFDLMAGVAPATLSMTGVGEPVQLYASRVSAQHFDIVGVRAALGRTFVEGDDRLGNDHIAVIAHTLWQTQFGGDPKVIGRSINLDGEPYIIIGVLPKNTPFERWLTRVWVPLSFTPANLTRNSRWFFAIARLKPGVTLQEANAQMAAICQRIALDYPESNKGWGISIEQRQVPPELKQQLYILFAAVGIVLLIACGNLTNLSLMRVAKSEREIAIRLALGAGRGALLRQFIIESLMLSLAGGVLGLAVGYVAMKVLNVTAPQYSLPPEAEVTLDGTVLMFSFILAVATGLVVGLLPAFRAARPNLTLSLKQDGVGASASGSHGRVRGALVVVEIALAFMLLTGAGLLIRSLGKLSQVDPGFISTNVLTFGLPVSEKQFADPAALSSFLHQVTVRLRALPGVTEVALTSALPMRGWGVGLPFQIADQKTADPSKRQGGFFKIVSPSYHRALGMRLLLGRLLADTDVDGAPRVIVINETLAKKFFPDITPVGKRLLIPQIVPGKPQLGNEVSWEVVGVVGDEQVGGLDNTRESPGMYVSNEQSIIYSQSVVIRSAIAPSLLQDAVTKAVHEVSPDQVVADVMSLDLIKTESLGNNRYRASLLGAFAAVALLLSAVGIYSVISYSVTQRTREIGIRTALGASRSNVQWLVLRHGLTLTGFGLVVGIGGALGLARVLASTLFGISEHDPLTMMVVAGALGLVALTACIFPVWRATKVDPLIALRAE